MEKGILKKYKQFQLNILENSGGGLVNTYDQIIGINSSKIVATDYKGLGFAIPVNKLS